VFQILIRNLNGVLRFRNKRISRFYRENTEINRKLGLVGFVGQSRSDNRSFPRKLANLVSLISLKPSSRAARIGRVPEEMLIFYTAAAKTHLPARQLLEKRNVDPLLVHRTSIP